MSAEAFANLAGRRVLLVEDDAGLAALFTAVLQAQGCTILGPADTVASALALAELEPAPDVAVLDLKLGGALSWPVIQRLSDRGVPAVIISGYSSIFVPQPSSGPAILNKPITPEFLLDAISSALAAQKAAPARTSACASGRDDA